MTQIDLSRSFKAPDWLAVSQRATEIGDSHHLERQFIEIADEVKAAVEAVLPSGKYTLGPRVAEFERAFAEYCDSKFCIGMASGTAALHLALEALGVGPGDEVITVSNTYVATAFAISYTGATPVFADVDPQTYNMTADLVAPKITSRTRALIPVHLYGHPVDMDPLMELAKARGLWVLEDASHSHGATYKGRKTGSLGHIAAFSFYPGKNLGAYGDGGAITTSDPELNEKVRMLRYIGQRVKWVHEVIGFQERLDEIQAAILSVKLKRLDEWNERRRRWAAIYDKMLADSPLVLPRAAGYARHVYYSYAALAADEKERLELMTFLADRGISTFAMYPTLVPLHGAYAHLGYREEDFPVSALYTRRVLNLPMFETLREDEVRRVAETVLAFYDRR
ncbi:MAG: DegT/DnrJ/EryC1/StrS family aminotransferase [Chloroflexi bacterium]|nr:DegT/DnrJ/EryC1/StrS family aminotransferase [Chloroflexota bacterium]